MILDELVQRLIAQGVGIMGASTSTSTSVRVWKGLDPDAPGTNVIVYETPGAAPLEVFASTRPSLAQHRVQVVARSTSYETARSKAQDAYNAFYTVVNQNLASTASTGYYARITPAQEPFLIGRDERRRSRVGFNADVLRAG